MFASRLLAKLAALWTVLIASLASAHASQPLVDVAWVKANLGKPGILFLDVRSGAGISKEIYLKGHIPGAVFTDYAKGGWREKTAEGVEGQLPRVDKLEKVIGAHGIDNDTHVVLIPEGRFAQDMGAATRLYWTLKVLGHDKVSILDGGFMAWVGEVDKDKRPVNPLEASDVIPGPKTFKAKLRPEMLVNRQQVKAALEDKVPIVDNRPYDFHVGLTKSPAAKTAGTIPGSLHLPEGWFTQNGGGKFRSKAQLARLYQTARVPETGKQIMFCNTGHWASLGWFVSSEILGNKDVLMFSGSMSEWTQDASLPVHQIVKLD
jgi:thiosulfate/3-mercaptopyruvate sulfurtransferase